jgi:hypothetical protein
MLRLDRARKAVIAFGFAFLCTCDGLTTITVGASGQASIPQATLVDQLLGGALDFAGLNSIQFDQQFANQGVSKDEVDSVHLESFDVTIDSPKGETFDFLEAITVTASSDGLPTIAVAKLDPVPKGKTKIHLEVNADAELKPYVVAPSMTLGVSVKGQHPAHDTQVNAEASLDVDVHVLGCN